MTKEKINCIDMLHRFIGILDAQISNKVTRATDELVAYI